MNPAAPAGRPRGGSTYQAGTCLNIYRESLVDTKAGPGHNSGWCKEGS